MRIDDDLAGSAIDATPSIAPSAPESYAYPQSDVARRMSAQVRWGKYGGRLRHGCRSQKRTCTESCVDHYSKAASQNKESTDASQS